MEASTSTPPSERREGAGGSRLIAAVHVALLLAGCRSAPQRSFGPHARQEAADAPLGPANEPSPLAPLPEIELEPQTGSPWWHATVDVRYPVRIGFADFDFGDGQALDSVTAVSFLPTADFHLNLDHEWTLIPFLGLGGGWLIDDGSGILIATTGIRALYVREFGQGASVRVQPRLRYDVNMNQPDGLLGDLGQTDLVLELRKTLGDPEDALVLEPGLYAQGFWFWDDIEFDVPGLTPESIENQLELGISFAPRDPVTVFGFELPRVFVGYRFGNQVEILEIRFGEL